MCIKCIGVIKPAQVIVSGPNLENLEKWRVLGATVTTDNGAVVSKCDIVFICVKPHLLQICASQVESTIKPGVRDKDVTFVSVLAGVALEQLEKVKVLNKCWDRQRVVVNTCIFCHSRPSIS